MRCGGKGGNLERHILNPKEGNGGAGPFEKGNGSPARRGKQLMREEAGNG